MSNKKYNVRFMWQANDLMLSSNVIYPAMFNMSVELEFHWNLDKIEDIVGNNDNLKIINMDTVSKKGIVYSLINSEASRLIDLTGFWDTYKYPGIIDKLVLQDSENYITTKNIVLFSVNFRYNDIDYYPLGGKEISGALDIIIDNLYTGDLILCPFFIGGPKFNFKKESKLLDNSKTTSYTYTKDLIPIEIDLEKQLKLYKEYEDKKLDSKNGDYYHPCKEGIRKLILSNLEYSKRNISNYIEMG
jgi:hypothetical protein